VDPQPLGRLVRRETSGVSGDKVQHLIDMPIMPTRRRRRLLFLAL
jgi:hypothetical protein